MTQNVRAKIIASNKNSFEEVDQYLIDVINSRYSVLQNPSEEPHNNSTSQESTEKSSKSKRTYTNKQPRNKSNTHN